MTSPLCRYIQIRRPINNVLPVSSALQMHDRANLCKTKTQENETTWGQNKQDTYNCHRHHCYPQTPQHPTQQRRFQWSGVSGAWEHVLFGGVLFFLARFTSALSGRRGRGAFFQGSFENVFVALCCSVINPAFGNCHQVSCLFWPLAVV